MADQATAPVADPIAISIRSLLANGSTKAALDRAKQHHKEHPSAGSRALLLDVYLERIQALQRQDLATEAQSLMDLVKERFPEGRDRFLALQSRLQLRRGSLDESLGLLVKPGVTPEELAFVNTLIGTEVHDLALIANSEALPTNHPLRVAATVLDRALRTVVSGNGAGIDLALPEISWRSPLAAWKYLIRAIAAFYQGDAETCRQQLDSIPAGAPPARAVAPLRHLLDSKHRSQLSPAARRLVDEVLPPRELATEALRRLDRAFASGKDKQILSAIREATDLVRRYAPDRLDTVKHHIAADAYLAGLDPEPVVQAMGGASVRNAARARLLARVTENSDDPYEILTACTHWHEFIDKAAEEGWFSKKSIEAAQVYLHTAVIAGRVPPEFKYLVDRAPATERERYLPDFLYRKAVELDPSPDTFRPWLDWARRQRGRTGEIVAENWIRARPSDLEPHLYLVDRCAEREAYPSALKHLANAEKIDSMHAETRAMRARLLINGALRQLQQKRPHLVEQRIRELEELPEMRQGDRTALIDALAILAHTALGKHDLTTAAWNRIDATLNGRIASLLLITGMGRQAKLPFTHKMPDAGDLAPEISAQLPLSLARVDQLAHFARLHRMHYPISYLQQLPKLLPRHSKDLTAEQLEALGRIGTGTKWNDVTYAVSTVGLDRSPNEVPRFLLLRAAATRFQHDRARVCASAAHHLAVKLRDNVTAGRALDLLGGPPEKFTDEIVSEILRRERTSRTFSEFSSGPNYDDILDVPDFDYYGPDGEDEDENMFDEFIDARPPGMSADVARVLAEAAVHAASEGVPMEDFVRGLVESIGAPPRGPGKRRGNRRGGRR
ncbi:MAG: hypothetical protein HY820_18510 [Acidobacteria bacterium]|nr:hypothetical protein [Acidobacteriota bacterium]